MKRLPLLTALLLAAGLAGCGGSPTSAPAATGSNGAGPIQTSAAERADIRRILDEDQRASQLEPNSRAFDAMRAIRRGAAPEDFWAAYQTHVATEPTVLAAEQSPDPARSRAAEQEYRRTYNLAVEIARRRGVEYSGFEGVN